MVDAENTNLSQIRIFDFMGRESFKCKDIEQIKSSGLHTGIYNYKEK